MLITPTNLNIFFTQVETRFWMAYGNATTWYQRIATTYPATTEAWMSGWIGMLDKLRVWHGPRVIREPAPSTYTAPILPFELTERVDQFKLMDDTYGIYFPVMAMMGENAAKWPDWTLRDLLQGNGEFAGAAQVGIDGLAHWHATHPVDPYDAAKGTYPNDYGTAGVVVDGVTVGGTFSVPAWSTVWQDMSARKHEGGEAIGVNPDLTLVPSQLLFPGKVITQSGIFSPPQLGSLGSGSGANAPFVGAMDNPFRGATDLLHTPDLNNEPTAWYMLATGRAIKPFGWVLRQAPVTVVRNAPQDPSVFDQHAYVFGVWSRGTAVWGFPWMSSRSGVA